jgi:hypothetical protein
MTKRRFIVGTTMDLFNRKRGRIEVCGLSIRKPINVRLQITLDDPISVERENEDSLYFQHFISEKMLCNPGEGKLLFLTDSMSKSLELIAVPVLRSDRQIKEGHSYNLLNRCKASFKQPLELRYLFWRKESWSETT